MAVVPTRVGVSRDATSDKRTVHVAIVVPTRVGVSLCP